MSAYTINFSDVTKNPIIINTGTINYSTSLGLIGRNAAGFGPVLAKDLLQLLENFASQLPPANAIEGQLWYDTSDSLNKRLRINDGTGFTNSLELGGVFRKPNSNPPTNARLGDIWVDTTNNQIKIWNGNDFTLIGPNFSSITQTGTYPDSILGTDGARYSVIKEYLDGDVLTIITTSSFRPAAVIEGFLTLTPGVNLSTKGFNGTTPTFNGVATQASALKVTSPAAQIVPSNNFFRKDIPQSLNEALTINNNSGISIGLTSSTFLLTKSGRDAVILNYADQANIIFKIDSNGVRRSILTVSGQNQRVGINDINPAASLSVNGTVLISGATTITNSVNISGSLIATGRVQLRGQTTVNSTATFVDTITVSATNTNIAITPSVASTYDIGSVNNRFRKIWVDYIGTGTTRLEGTAYSADRLTNPQLVSMSGQITAAPISFNGSQAVSLITRLTDQAITAQPSTDIAKNYYTLPVVDSVTSSLYKITKQQLFAEVTPNIVYPGYIMLFPTFGNNPPDGWVWCDGTEYPASGEYSDLYVALGGARKPYGTPPSGIFCVPNLNNIVPTNSTNSSTYVVRYMIKY